MRKWMIYSAAVHALGHAPSAIAAVVGCDVRSIDAGIYGKDGTFPLGPGYTPAERGEYYWDSIEGDERMDAIAAATNMMAGIAIETNEGDSNMTTNKTTGKTPTITTLAPDAATFEATLKRFLVSRGAMEKGGELSSIDGMDDLEEAYLTFAGALSTFEGTIARAAENHKRRLATFAMVKDLASKGVPHAAIASVLAATPGMNALDVHEVANYLTPAPEATAPAAPAAPATT